jgi:hypothetical protein
VRWDHIPVSLLAGEWGLPVDALIRQFGEDRVIVDALGIRRIRCIDAAALFEQRQAEQAAAAAADAARIAEMARQSAASRARIKAIGDHQDQLRDSGQCDRGMSAYALMSAGDSAGLERAGRKFDALFNAARRGEAGVGYRFQSQKG